MTLRLEENRYLIFTGYQSKDGKTQRFTDKVLLTAFEVLKEPGRTALGTASNQIQDDLSSSSSIIASTNGEVSSLGSATGKLETPHVKKRHRRMKSSGLKKDGDGDGMFSSNFCFTMLQFYIMSSLFYFLQSKKSLNFA